MVHTRYPQHSSTVAPQVVFGRNPMPNPSPNPNLNPNPNPNLNPNPNPNLNPNPEPNQVGPTETKLKGKPVPLTLLMLSLNGPSE